MRGEGNYGDSGRGDSEGDWFSDLIESLMVPAVVIAAIFVIAGLLDSWFGWGLTDWLWAQIGKIGG